MKKDGTRRTVLFLQAKMFKTTEIIFSNLLVSLCLSLAFIVFYVWAKLRMKEIMSWFSEKRTRRCNKMTNRNNTINVPEARDAMDKFKMEAANEVGVNLKNGYNGDLTSRQAGSVGGQMVKKMIEAYENGLK